MDRTNTKLLARESWWQKSGSPISIPQAIDAIEVGDKAYTTVMMITQNCICFLAIAILSMIVWSPTFQIVMISTLFIACMTFNIAVFLAYFTKYLFYLWLVNFILGNSIVISGLLA